MKKLTDVQEKLLKMQQRHYAKHPCEDRRFFIFWHGNGSHPIDEERAFALDGMCEMGLFYKVDREMGIYRITDAGLVARS